METPDDIAKKFTKGYQIKSVKRFGSGNINDTFKVDIQADTATSYILQRINTNVFKEPVLIIDNMKKIISHINDKIRKRNQSGQTWQIPQIVKTFEEKDYYIAENGTFWRAITYIDHSKTYEKLEKISLANEAGYALGKFHNLLNDLDVTLLNDTLVGFHITPNYLDQFDIVSQQTSRDLSCSMTKYCNDIIQKNRSCVNILEDAKVSGDLIERTIHGDPKIANILFHQSKEYALGIIDLDTVKPGLVHYDIGDCLRSCCNRLGEDTQDFDAVSFDLEICQQILNGYLSQAKAFFTKPDYQYLYSCIHLLAFELGIRFFNDYLAGDKYYKIDYPKHNLHRGLTQLKLAESIEKLKPEIDQIIKTAKLKIMI